MRATLDQRITLRPASISDAAFLLRVYGSTRIEELAAVPWSDGEKNAFIAMQHAAQTRAYSCYENANQRVIMCGGRDAGRLFIASWREEIRIIDISLLPDFRGKGIGTYLLKQIMGEAAASGRSVTVHVERFNPAQRLYERLGFEVEATRGIHFFMRANPGASFSRCGGRRELQQYLTS